MKKYYLAIDIGASSGRHIAGFADKGDIFTQEVYRFPNGVKEEGGHLVWDIDGICRHVVAGIRAAVERYGEPLSVAIDTWGVDYVLMKGDVPIYPCYAYRDDRTAAATEAVHARVPFKELYARTGIQFQPFNTIYQLFDDLQKGRLDGVTDMLMIPEYIAFMLTGTKKREYTNATTEIAAAVGGQTEVVLCATHDTASAVEAIEGEGPYISSGTWSLLGIKTERALTDENSRRANWSNEGGVGYVRYQKNIMGLWLVQSLRRELCPDKDFGTIAAEARASAFDGVVDVNDNDFLAPDSMAKAISSRFAEGGKPVSESDFFRCAFLSLAHGYKLALDELSSNVGKRFDTLTIVGGGAKNDFLNQLTEEICKVKVNALPIEATAIGNLKIQKERYDNE